MRYVITHGHIFKNAGTTFDHALEKAFGKDFCDHRDDMAMRKGGSEYLKQFIMDNPSLKAISSHHLCNPLPISDEFTCIPIYFLRNPIERIVSVYNFERRQKDITKGAEMASKLSLIDYVKWRMSPETPKVISNYQTAYIGRTRNLGPNKRVNASIFFRATKIINDSTALIGVVERFGESFQYITKQLNIYFPKVVFSYENKNVSNAKSANDKYSKAVEALLQVLPDIIRENTFDLALHTLANQKLETLINSGSATKQAII